MSSEDFKLTPTQRSLLAVLGLSLSFLGGMVGLFLSVTAILDAKESKVY
jgi:hypothetical protein